jgi:hypothetical protein
MKVTSINSYHWCLTNVGHETIARVLKLRAVSMRTMRKQQWLTCRVLNMT